jgi:hypothetical protein
MALRVILRKRPNTCDFQLIRAIQRVSFYAESPFVMDVLNMNRALLFVILLAIQQFGQRPLSISNFRLASGMRMVNGCMGLLFRMAMALHRI